MKAFLTLCFLALLAARPADAQQARAQISASVTVVEGIGVAAGATAVTRQAGGTLDVTTPLLIRGSAPRVVQVVHGERARPISAQLASACAAADRTESCAVRSRISLSDPREGDRLLTYLVATVN
ncbi:MAG: hypothetical protein KY467_04100 [Gemmatimonadetes bacterium]|nr:hypothetical protein [Gemmatimonadota bacterium]